MIIGIDASNLRSGGGITHLINILNQYKFDSKIEYVIVWSNITTLSLIPESKFILKKSHPFLNKNLFFRTFWQYFILNKEAKLLNCDLIFVPGGLYIGTFRPFVTMSRNLLPFESKELYRYGLSFETIRLLLLRFLQKKSFIKSDGLIFLNSYAKKVVLEYLIKDESKIEIIPHGINQKFINKHKEQFDIEKYKSYKIIYVSIIDVYKHQVNVVRAVDLLRKKTSWPLTLQLIGPANKKELKKLLKIIKDLDPRQDWVSYLGKKEYLSLINYYHNADLGIFASTCENMPNILLEKIASGLPVITSNHGANIEILGNDGVYFNADEPESIMSSLYEIIKSSNNREYLSNKSSQIAKKYNWEVTANLTFNFLVKIAEIYKNKKNKKQLIPFVDPHNDILIKNIKWVYFQPIKDQYVERKFSLSLLFNYIKKIGIKWVLIKIKSRYNEKERNKKYFGIGTGFIEKAPLNSKFNYNDSVVFFAPNNSINYSFLVLNKIFVEKYTDIIEEPISFEEILKSREYIFLSSYASWSSFSGNVLADFEISNSLNIIKRTIKETDFSRNIDNGIEYVDKFFNSQNFINSKKKPSAVLFGYGNYAKTAILPNIKKYINLKRVHEIDIDQLQDLFNQNKYELFTSPFAELDKKFDVWFIAGYHHTHSNLAITALNSGSYAVIEKPLSTNTYDFKNFYDLVSKSEISKFFICFHKRYSSFNKYINLDLNIIDNSPVDMHCIVYEIPLPSNHWYNWKNSGSRVISNACHWIDYFMFLNSYSDVIEYKVWNPKEREISIELLLSNNSILNLSLTDKGSERIGVRDYIELRKDKVTVKIIDGAKYESENDHKVLRKISVNPLESYTNMYKSISKKIYFNENGDNISSLKSSEITIKIEKLLNSSF